MSTARMRLASGSALLLCSFAMGQAALAQDGLNGEVFDLGTVVLTAEEQIKQALGTSTVTEGDIERLPVVNDVAEIIRKMPGVNLSGTSSTGQRGNQRQVDIRGMGPENVLILIDGKPVLSRMSVKQGRSSERDSRAGYQLGPARDDRQHRSDPWPCSCAVWLGRGGRCDQHRDQGTRRRFPASRHQL